MSREIFYLEVEIRVQPRSLRNPIRTEDKNKKAQTGPPRKAKNLWVLQFIGNPCANSASTYHPPKKKKKEWNKAVRVHQKRLERLHVSSNSTAPYILYKGSVFTLFMTTGSSGLSDAFVGTAPITETTSCPFTTSPKIV